LDAQGMENVRKAALAALKKEEGLSFTQRLKFRRMINDPKSSVYTEEIDGLLDFPSEVQMEVYRATRENLPSRANIIPVYVRAENPFDYQSPEHVQRVVERVKEIRGDKRIDANLLQDLSEGLWDRIELDDVQSAIKSLGFDSFYVKEGGRKNLGVYQPNQLKSQFNKGTFSTDSGNILEAAVSSNKNTEKAAGITAPDYRSFSERIAPAALSTRFAFDTIGWDKNVTERVTKGAAKLADMIRKDFPAAERLMIYMNATFSAGKYTAQQLKDFVVNKDVGYQQMERLANTVASRPADEVLKLIAYMDGNEKALDGVPNAEVLTRTATNVNKWMKEYIKELPKEDRAFFENKKFSETLLYATRTEQLARGSIGTGKLASVMGMKTVTEESLEGFQDWMAKNDEGDPILDGRFYQVFKKEGLKPGSVLEPAGFMSISTYEARGGKDPVGFVVDPTRQWWLSGGSKAKGYKFSSTMTAKQAIQENKADQLANAMRNTMSALAANYASKKLFDNLSEYGYEDGKPTALSVAFNDVAEIKEATGSTVREENILNASSDFSKIADVIRRYRRSGTWVRLPNSKSYGALAGKIIPGPVWTAMLDTSDTKPLYSIGVLNDAMRWFKKSKTSLNPGTHVTNIATNVTLAMMHDIPIRTLGKAAQMFVLYETSPSKLSKNELDMMSAFENSGAMLGNYSSVEVKKALVNAWQENMLMDDTSVAKRLAAFAKYEKSKAQQMVQAVTKVGKTIENVAAETYAAEDNIFRLAAFLTKVGDLQNVEKTTVATPEQLKAGGEFARSAFLDYNINSKAVKVARQSVLPFVSWPYAAAGLISRMALHQPWKIANLYLAYYLLDVGLAAMAGDDDDELRKAGPEYLRERMLFGMGPNMFVRLPFGDEQNPVYYKLGDYNPVEALTKGLPTNKFLGQSWIPAAVTPGGPFVSATLGLIGGVDPYTGKEIHKPTDSEWDKFLNAAKFSYDLVAPPFLSSRTYQKIKDIKDEKVSDTGVEPSSLYFARVLGLKAYNYDVDDSMIAQDKKVKSIEKDFKAAMRKARKEEYSKGYPDYDALDAELEILRERMERRIAKVRGEELEELEDELDEE